jgi:hypothetical protein
LILRKSFVLLFAALIMVAMLVGALSPVLADSVAENSWTSKAPMQQARSGAGVAVVNDKIYAIGGYSRSGVVGTNEEYDPATDTWVYKTPMPTPMSRFAITVFDNKIYCISRGVTDVYDPAIDVWESKTPMPEPGIAQYAVVVDDKIYVISSAFNQVYDPATDTWAIKDSYPIKARGAWASVVFNNKIYVISSLTQIYDPQTDQWSLGKAPLTDVMFSSALATGGVMAPERIYLFGWAHGDGGMISEGDPLYHVQVYDPVTDSWVSGAGIPTRRSSFSVAVVDDLFYVIGGYLHTYGEFPIGRTQPPKITYYAANERYTPFGYGTVAPKIEVISPENMTYFEGEVSLVFSVNKPVSWMAYSLSGQEKVVVEGNVTLGVLSEGLYNVTVYAVDMFGNLGTSQTISFTVAKAEIPDPTSAGLWVPVVAASGATIFLVGAASVLYYFKKRKR